MVVAAFGWGGLSAQAAVSVVAYNSSTASGPGFNLTVPAGQAANGVVVIVHCAAVDLAAENVNVTVGGAGAPAIQGGSILHNGSGDDVQLETFYRVGNWAGGAVIPIAWTWVGTAPTDYVVGAYALKGVSGADWPFQSVKFRSDPISTNPRSVLLPSINTAINGTIVLWAFASDSATNTASSAAPALSGATVTGWELNDAGGTPRLRAESWYGTVANANDSEVLGTTTGSGVDSRVVLVGMSILPVPPTVTSIVRASSDPTSAASVTFTVTFSEAVTGVGTNDFVLTTTGVSGASVASVSTDSGATRTVTVNTGSGSGTIRLDLADNDSIVNGEMNPLGGPGTVVTGNGSYSSGELYTIDKSPPAVTSVVRADASPTDWETVTFFVNFSEFVTGVGTNDFFLTTSGVTGAYVVSVWPAGSGAWKLVTVNTGSGSGTIRLDVIVDGSIVDALSTPLVTPYSSGESYQIDKTPPTGTISIDGPWFPPSDTVHLTLSASDSNGVTGMRFSNDNVSWSLEEAYGTGKTWTLSPFDGLKTVYVQYKDTIGNWSTAEIIDQVIRDTTPPTGTIAVGTGNGYTNSLGVNLTLSASDANGVALMRFSNDNATWSPDEAYGTSKAWTLLPGPDGLRTVYVQYKDNAGHWSTAPIRADVVLDTIPPTGEFIEIDGGAVYAASLTVDLALLASDDNDVVGMRFSNDNSNWGPEHPYGTSATWTLSPGDGVKTVYVQYKDNAGNWSLAISDDILLDMTPPNKPIVTGVSPTIDQMPTWSWSSGGGGIGTFRWDLEPGGLWAETTATSFTPGTDLAEGNYRMVVKELDDAGNWSEDSFFDIFVDLTDPVLTVNPIGLTNDVTPIFSGGVSDNFGVAKVEVAVVGGNTFVATVSGGMWHAQVPDEQPLAGTPPTSYIADVTATDAAGRTATKRIYFQVDSTVPTLVNYVGLGGASVTNASSVAYVVTFSLGVRGVSTGDFTLYADGPSGASITNVAGIVNSDRWTVTVNTGSGDGTIRLDVADDDTIIDIFNHPLGGTGLGNGNYSAGGAYTIDKTPPAGTITVDGGAYATSADVSLTLDASDAHGVTGMRFSNDNATWSAERPFAASTPWTLSSGDGAKTVYAQYKDSAGNWTSAAISDDIALDTTAPSGTLTINGGATYANSLDVALALDASDANGVAGMRFSNDNATWSPEEAYDTNKAWTLAPGDGAKTVYVQYKDAVGNWTDPAISSGIALDMTSPVVAVTYVLTNDNTPQISGTVVEAGGMPHVEAVVNYHSYTATVTSSGGGNYDWRADVTDVLPDGAFDVAATATDPAGNAGVDSTTDELVIDPGAPTMVENIVRAGSSPANAGSVQFKVTFSKGVNGVDASDFGMHADGIADASITGVSGGDGASEYLVTVDTGTGDGTVGIDVIDDDSIRDITYDRPLGTTGLGNGNFTTGETYVIDRTPPTGTIVIDGGAYAASEDVTVTLDAGDAHGVAGMRFSNDNATWSTEMPYAVGATWTLSSGDGAKTVYVQYRDAIGNWSSEVISGDITLDTTPPTVIISPPSVDSTRTGPVMYDVLYQGAAEVVLSTDHVHLIRTGTADGSVTVSRGKTDDTWQVTLDSITGQGALAIAIDAATSYDEAGNFDLGPAAPSGEVTVTYGVPVGGTLALGLLAAACLSSGLGALRRRAVSALAIEPGNGR